VKMAFFGMKNSISWW